MKRPGAATLGSVLLHAAVIAAALIPWPRKTPEIMVSSVPVSIVSSETVAAAPADNPADEMSPDEASEPETAEAETPPEPTPPEPVPTPPAPTPPPTPAPTPAPRPTPAPPEKRPTPTPPRATPTPAPTPPRKAPSLDLDALAQPTPRPTRPATRPATGDSGQGQAARATGAQIADLGGQIVQYWTLQCDIAGFNQVSIPVRVTISSSGRITSGPTLTERRDDPVWRTASESMLRAVRAAEPFDVPEGFQSQEINFRFRADQACRNR